MLLIDVDNYTMFCVMFYNDKAQDLRSMMMKMLTQKWSARTWDKNADQNRESKIYKLQSIFHKQKTKQRGF